MSTTELTYSLYFITVLQPCGQGRYILYIIILMKVCIFITPTVLLPYDSLV